MSIRWLAVLVAFLVLVTLALLVASKGGRQESPERTEERRAVRRFGRRKGEPRPTRRGRRQRLQASG